MSLYNFIVGIGVASIVICLVYIGRKLQILDDLKATSEKIKNNLKVVCDHLTGTDGTAFESGKLQTYSPISLTDLGKKYLKDIGFIEVFNQNCDDFYGYIESEKSTSDYDIENAAIRSVSVLFDKEYFQPVKEYLYNHPKEDKSELLKVAGIYVRDRYQDKHKPSFKGLGQGTE